MTKRKKPHLSTRLSVFISSAKRLFVIVMSAVMMIAADTGILHLTGDVGVHHIFDIAGTSSDYLDIVSFQSILRSFTHIAGQHQGDAHFLENGSDAGFTSAALW